MVLCWIQPDIWKITVWSSVGLSLSVLKLIQNNLDLLGCHFSNYEHTELTKIYRIGILCCSNIFIHLKKSQLLHVWLKVRTTYIELSVTAVT
jgi:hypothetical protein